MSPLVQGVVVFGLFSLATGVGVVTALRRQRREGGSLLAKLLPFIVADGLFAIIFVVWLLNYL